MKLLAIDVETVSKTRQNGRSLQPMHHDSVISTMAYSSDASGKMVSEGIFWPDEYSIRNVLRAAKDSGYIMVAWNAVFDIAWFISYGCREEVMNLQWLDGCLLWQRAEMAARKFHSEEFGYKGAQSSYSLKQAVREFIPEGANYEVDVDYNVPYGCPATDQRMVDLMHYNKLDTEFTLRLTKHFMSQLPREERAGAIIEGQILPTVADSWVRGIEIDRKAWDQSLGKLSKEIYEYTDAAGLDPELVTSSKKLRKVLFEDWGLPVVELTDGGAPSTNAHTLLTLALQDPRAEAIYRSRKARNAVSKFIEGPAESLKYMQSDTTHPQPRVAGTYTGRMTYESKQLKRLPVGIAIHQWAKGHVRDMIIPPEGYKLIELDAAGQEMRLMADASGDRVMCEVFAEGLDGHTLMGARIAGLHYSELEAALQVKDAKGIRYRKMGKLANLALQYRTGAKKLMERALVQFDMTITDQEATTIWQTYRDTYEYVPAYWAEAIERAKINGYAETQGHRRVALQDLWDTEKSWVLESAAINFPIQGTGGDIKSYAIAALHPWCESRGILFGWDLHDGLFYYAPESEADDLAREMRTILDGLDYGTWGWEPRVPMTWTAATGPTWGQMEEL